MKKILAVIFTFILINTTAFAFSFCKKDADLVTVPLFTTESNAKNTVWVGTFQLVWNDLMDDIVKGEVYLRGGNDDVVNGLNAKPFTADMISPKSYYKTHGVTTTVLRDTINKALKEKFNETSDILKGVDWNGHDYLLYAMLKKDFKFPYVYDELQAGKFANSKTNVKYFGINKDTEPVIRDMVDVMFYNSKNDYAVILRTKGNDLLFLYRTDNSKLSLADAYKQMLEKSFKYDGNKTFGLKDELKIPFVKFKNEYAYKNLENKRIEGTDFTISSALQTVDFNMDNKGVKLKSEAAMIMKMSLPRPDKNEKREFNFDKNFYMFMQEGLNEPYFAMKIGDVTKIK